MIFRNIVDGRILISNARLINITCLSKVVHHSRVSFPIILKPVAEISSYFLYWWIIYLIMTNYYLNIFIKV